MGALFEFIAGLLIAMTASALAHFGLAIGGVERARRDPPAVQRTLLQSDVRPASRGVLLEECDEKSRLQSA